MFPLIREIEQPAAQFLQWLWIQAVNSFLRLTGYKHSFCCFQDLEMLRNRRSRALEMPGNLACRKISSLGQQLDDFSPIWLRYGTQCIHRIILARSLI